MSALHDIIFTAAQLAWKAKAKEIAIEHLLPNALMHDREESFNEAAFTAACEAGMLGVWIPKEYGGTEDGILALALMVEEFS